MTLAVTQQMIDNVDNLSQKQIVELLELLEKKEQADAQVKYLTVYNQFYEWQVDFTRKTAEYYECCLCAANQIGKTFTGTTIDALHLLGDYPEGYEGHKFAHAPLCWLLGFSMMKTRDLLQTPLFGKFIAGKNGKKTFQGGLIPADRIISWESSSVTNAMSSVTVRHKSGRHSIVQFWSYAQGQHAIMGDVVDWFHVDEEPRDQTIRPQLLTRTINGDKGRGGRGIYTFTPENGRTELVINFMDSPSSAQYFVNKGWSDAPHISKEKAERLLESYPEYQRDMRSKGIPMLGHGLIYQFSDDFISCDPFEIPDHFFVICGLDFGWDHPQAVIKLAHDRDNDIIYLVYSWKQSKVSADDARGATRHAIGDYPISWPHDGLQHEKGRDDTKQLKEHYVEAGFNMLFERATFQCGSNSVETGIYEINNLLAKGKFKIFRGCFQAFEEFRTYHRDEKSKIVKTNDDIMDAIRYAYMMRRYAVRAGDNGQQPKVRIPNAIPRARARR